MNNFISIALAAVFGVTPIAASQPVAIETSRIAIDFDAATGDVISLRDRATSRQWLAPQKTPSLFQLEFAQRSDSSAKRLMFSNHDTKNVVVSREPDDDGMVIRLTFTDLAARGINVICSARVKNRDPYVRWRLEARFPESLVLESVRFPRVVLRIPTGKEASDALVMGNTKGGVRRGLSDVKVGTTFSATQPGSLAAQFACYYDDAGGLMTAALDAQGHRKTISATRAPEGLSLQWLQPCYASAPYIQDYDVVWTMFTSAESGRPADWRDAADLYKRWAIQQPWCKRTFADRQDLPAWLRQGPAMVRFHRQWLSEPETVERWLTDYWRAEFGTQIPLIIAYWGWEKVDSWITPEYFPVYPSDEQFRRLTQLGRQMNGHTFLWPSGYHYTVTFNKRPDGTFAWDDRERFERTAKPHAVCGRDGKILMRDCSWLKGGQNATVCGDDPWTIDWFNQIAVGCAERGAELVQVDQVVGGNFPVCYSSEHGHPPGPGRWSAESFHRQLQTMLAACRKVQPDAVVCFEEPNELFNQEVGLQDYRDWEVLKGPNAVPASVFGYLYHEYLPAFQSNPQAHNRLQSAYCLVNGQIPHFVPQMLLGPGPLLVNGQFERPLGSGWEKVAGWKNRLYTGEAAIDPSQHHEGNTSLRLSNREDSQVVQVSQNVPLGETFQPGRTYRLSLWMKGDRLRRGNSVGLAGLAEHTQSTGSWNIPMPHGSSDWTKGEARFTLSAGTNVLRIMLNLSGPGTLWIDDVSLDEIAADGTVKPVGRPDKPRDHELMRRWVNLFHGEGRPYLLLGKMLHPPALQTGSIEVQGRHFPAILHNAFEAPNGSRALVMVNVSDSPQEARFLWGGQTQTVTLRPWEVQLLSAARP